MTVKCTRSADGGVDVTLSLSEADAQALGEYAHDMASYLDTVLHTIARLRSGRYPRGPKLTESEVDFWANALVDAFSYLLPCLQGFTDAVLRAAHAAGMSHTQIGLCMEVPRSTAQSRVQKVTGRPATESEDRITQNSPGTLAWLHSLRASAAAPRG